MPRAYARAQSHCRLRRVRLRASEQLTPTRPGQKKTPTVRKGWGSDANYCGATGNRTPDLLLAKQALYQLSYGPEPFLARGGNLAEM